MCRFLPSEIGSYYDFPMQNIGWMFPFDSMLQPLFDKYMFELYQSGVINRILKFYNPKLDTCTVKEFHQVDLNFVMLAFKCISFGLGISLILAIIEKCGISTWVVQGKTSKIFLWQNWAFAETTKHTKWKIHMKLLWFTISFNL